MGKIEDIKKAIENAEKGISKLTPEVMSIGGYTSNKIRHLLNNLGSISTDYFEIGCHRGATMCATIYGNDNLKSIVACDDYSEFNVDNPRLDLVLNLVKHSPINTPQIISHDAFAITQLENKPDLYLYDGSHAEWAQRMALTHFYNMLPDEFIFLVDDYQWEVVRIGIQDAIKECGFQVLFEQELGMDNPSDANEYWNGFYVSLLKKTI